MFEDLDKAIREAFDEDNETIATLRLRCEEAEKQLATAQAESVSWRKVLADERAHAAVRIAAYQELVADLKEEM